MKLRNKKTGEIVERVDITIREVGVVFNNDETYNSLAELNDEWEDYEEQKEYWYIDYDGGILCGEKDNSSAERMMISMGNHFESLEEAEKAVEKLKAVKRLRDKGFRFIGLGKDRYGVEDIKYHIELPTDTKGLGIIEDLNTCFSEEENE